MAFQSLRTDLDRERTYMNQKWSAREKQLTVVMENMTGMVGDVRGLTGESLEIGLPEDGDANPQGSNGLDDSVPKLDA